MLEEGEIDEEIPDRIIGIPGRNTNIREINKNPLFREFEEGEIAENPIDRDFNTNLKYRDETKKLMNKSKRNSLWDVDDPDPTSHIKMLESRTVPQPDYHDPDVCGSSFTALADILQMHCHENHVLGGIQQIDRCIFARTRSTSNPDATHLFVLKTLKNLRKVYSSFIDYNPETLKSIYIRYANNKFKIYIYGNEIEMNEPKGEKNDPKYKRHTTKKNKKGGKRLRKNKRSRKPKNRH